MMKSLFNSVSTASGSFLRAYSDEVSAGALAAVALCVVILLFTQKASSRDIVAKNNEQIAGYNAQAAIHEENIDYYTYKTTQEKNDFIEEAARDSGYVYENETRYNNSTPGR